MSGRLQVDDSGQGQGNRINLALSILSVLFGLVFLGAGVTKLVGAEFVVEHRELWGFPSWIPYSTGAIEALAGLLLMVPATRFYSSVFLALMMALGSFSHLREGALIAAVLALLLLLGCAAVAWNRRRLTRVAATADPHAFKETL